MEQTTRTENVARRERKAKRLADKLFFKLDRQGSRYSLRRTTGVSSTVRRENLSLDEELRDYRILPLLARMRPGFALRLNHDEADDAFEVPLALLMAPENHKRESRDWNGFTEPLRHAVRRLQHLGRDRRYRPKFVERLYQEFLSQCSC